MKTATPPSRYELLVNPVTIRGSIRRQFQNKIEEVLRELFQNSQRACASRVDVNTIKSEYNDEPCGWSYLDNGHGLRAEGSSDPRDFFLTLLQMGTSYFENSNVPQQKPMGLGFHALLAHDQVSKVVLTSDYFELEIDAERWWSDLEYAQSWSNRIQRVTNRQDGMLISVYCSAEMLDDLPHVLPHYGYKCPTMTRKDYWKLGKPAQGYEGILKIYRDGDDVDTNVPDNVRIDRPLIVTQFRGSELKITTGSGHDANVNWYGQIVPVRTYDTPCVGLKFLLTVTSGAPVNPIAPTRSKLIEDEAYHDLLHTVKETFLTWAFTSGDPRAAHKSVVRTAQKLDPKRWMEESPFFIARRIKGETREHGYTSRYDPRESEDWNHYSHCTTGTVIAYAEMPPVVLRSEVVELSFKDGQIGEVGWQEGLPLWMSMVQKTLAEEGTLGDVYFVGNTGDYNEERLPHPLKTLYWRPGDPHFPDVKVSWDDRADFFERGRWGLALDGEVPETWHEVTEDMILFDEPGHGEIPNWRVACEDPMGFLENGSLLSCLSDSSSEYRNSNRFWTAIENLQRTVLGNAIPTDFSWGDLNAAVKGRPTAVTFIYEAGSEKPCALRIESEKLEYVTGADSSVWVKQEPVTRKLHGISEHRDEDDY